MSGSCAPNKLFSPRIFAFFIFFIHLIHYIKLSLKFLNFSTYVYSHSSLIFVNILVIHSSQFSLNSQKLTSSIIRFLRQFIGIRISLNRIIKNYYKISSLSADHEDLISGFFRRLSKMMFLT